MKDWLAAEQAVMPDGSIKKGLSLAHPKLPPLSDTHALRSFKDMQSINAGTRALVDSVMVPEVRHALMQWSLANVEGVIVGGLAYSFWCKPRYTEDIDVLTLSFNAPDVVGFKRHRASAYQEVKYHVEVDVLTPDFLNIPLNVCKQVIDSAVVSGNVKVASVEGLIAMKLFANRRKDTADIVELLKHYSVDMSAWPLTAKERLLFSDLKNEAFAEKQREIK